LLTDLESPIQWNTILPINIGTIYHFSGGNIQPFAGGELVFIPGYVREATGAAGGLRIRGGTNLILADTLGLNINLSTGFWRGKDFDKVQLGLNESGFVPHLSAGTTFYF
jgi:hypothetical protein